MDDPRKSLLLFDNGNEWGGGTNSMLELLKRIDRQRFTVHCCFYHNYRQGQGDSIEQVLNGLGIPVHFLPQRAQPGWAKLLKECLRTLVFFSRPLRQRAGRFVDRQWRILPNARRLQALLRQGNYQLLYMNNQPASNIEGYLAAAELALPLVQHCRIEPVADADAVRLVNQHADCVIAVSQGVQQRLIAQGVAPQRCTTVFNAIDIHQPLPDRQQMRQTLLNVDDDTFVFGSIGSLITRKSHHHTLAALARFAAAHPTAKWQMVFLGEGPELAKLQQQAQQAGIADRVIFAGFKRNAFDYLCAFDAFILASKSEGLPRVVLEAMLLQTAVIGSRVTGTEELIDHQRTGLLFDYGDSTTLSQWMGALYQDSSLRQRLLAQANQHVKHHYAIEHYVAGVEQVLEKALAGKSTHV